MRCAQSAYKVYIEMYTSSLFDIGCCEHFIKVKSLNDSSELTLWSPLDLWSGTYRHGVKFC